MKILDLIELSSKLIRLEIKFAYILQHLRFNLLAT